MYNELFESVIRTSGENTDDIDDFDDRDNFWAPVPEIERIFEQILREMSVGEVKNIVRKLFDWISNKDEKGFDPNNLLQRIRNMMTYQGDNENRVPTIKILKDENGNNIEKDVTLPIPTDGGKVITWYEWAEGF